MSDAVITRPIMRYHGGKWRLAKWIISYFPAHRVYIEPFGGAASVLMQKPRSYAEVYNDLDGEIVNVFRVLRNPSQARELIRQIQLTPFAREEFELTYYADDDPIEQARRTIFRSFAGFGSNAMNTQRPTGFRANSNRSGTIPAHDWMNFPEHIQSFVDRLAGVVIENRNYYEVIRAHDQEYALIYADPPYVHETRKKRQTGNYRHEMSDEQHIELADELKKAKGFVVLSGYRCDLYEELYRGWQRFDKVTMADGAKPRLESLWLNQKAYESLTQKRLWDAL